ncbi:MAG: hypothetical protein OXC55_09205, partial [Chloroflexi bacterium]|nr:hypothetical protein [Chloroflexota bacterium]
YSVSIRADSSGVPGTSLGTLTKSGSLSPLNAWTLVDFPVSGDGIDLAANTRYWLVSSANNTVRIAITNDDGEDTGGAAGWSIGNEDSLEFKNSNWVSNTFGALQFAVRGYAIDRLSQPPRAPITVTYTNANDEEETVEVRAASADRDTLYSYFYDSCQSRKNLSASAVAHDYSHYTVIDLPGGGTKRVMIQAANGWK